MVTEKKELSEKMHMIFPPNWVITNVTTFLTDLLTVRDIVLKSFD